MTQDWCPGIREACAHWRDAPMLQQTFEALELWRRITMPLLIVPRLSLR